MSTASSGNGKKGKGQKISLADFIGQSGSGESWADMPSQPVVVASTLPSQPAAMASDRPGARTEPDFSRIKSTGPFIAYVGNFPYETSEDNLNEFFRGLNVASIKILHDRVTHKSRGLGYVEFQDEQSLRHAVGASGTNFLGRPIKIDVAEEKQSYHSQESRASSSLAARYGTGRGMERQERYTVGGFDRSEMQAQSAQPMRSSSGGFNRAERYVSGGFDRSEQADRYASGGFDRSEMHARAEKPAPKNETPSDWRRESGNVSQAPAAQPHREEARKGRDESRRERPAASKPVSAKFSDTDFVFRRPE